MIVNLRLVRPSASDADARSRHAVLSVDQASAGSYEAVPHYRPLLCSFVVLLLTLVQGCGHSPRSGVQRLTEKPCLEAGVSVGASEGSLFGALAILTACTVAAAAVDEAISPEARRRSREARECPQLNAQAFVPMGTDAHTLDFAVNVGTVAPISPDAVRVDAATPHPAGCWLQTGIDATVLRDALVTVFPSAAVANRAWPQSLTLNAAVISQEEGEAAQSREVATRKVRVAIRYALTKPPAMDEIWSELITSDATVDHGGEAVIEESFGRKTIRVTGRKMVQVSVAQIAYERALRENLYSLARRLHTVTLP